MAKTVLEYVQATLGVMDSDNVDSIADTVESMQVAEQLKEIYAEVLNRQEWPWLRKPIKLIAAADVVNPTQFTIPENIKHLEKLRYNVSEVGEFKTRNLRYVTPDEWLCNQSGGEGVANRLLITLPDHVEFYISTDQWPTCWTTFDETTVVLDSVNLAFETTLQQSKLGGFAIVIPDFVVSDTFEPVIPQHMQPLLQSELNRECFKYFKQIESSSDEAKAKRQLANARREGSRVDRPNSTFYRNSFGRCTRAGLNGRGRR